jgi:hypothetical protein
MIIWALTAIKPRIYVAGTRRREYVFLVWRGDVVVGKQGMKSGHTSVKWLSHPVTNPLPRTHALCMFDVSPLVTPHVDKDTLYPTSCWTRVL